MRSILPLVLLGGLGALLLTSQSSSPQPPAPGPQPPAPGPRVPPAGVTTGIRQGEASGSETDLNEPGTGVSVDWTDEKEGTPLNSVKPTERQPIGFVVTDVPPAE